MKDVGLDGVNIYNIKSVLGKPHKSYFLVARLSPPSPTSLVAIRTFFPFFSLKIAENGFWQKKILPNMFGLKEPYFFLPNIATNLLKN